LKLDSKIPTRKPYEKKERKENKENVEKKVVTVKKKDKE